MIHFGNKTNKELKLPGIGIDIPSQSTSRNSITGKLKDLVQRDNRMSLFNFINSSKLAQKYFVNDVCSIKFDGKIGEGEMLGENDVLLNETYSLLIIPIKELYVFSITKENIHKILDNLQTTAETKEIFSNIMPKVNENAITKLCMCIEEKSFRINEVIYEQGDSVDCIFFIKSGEIQVIFIIIRKN